MRHTQSRFPFPRGASLFYGRDASRLVGWDGAGGRASSSRSHHTHNHTRGFCAPRAQPSHLEPNRVGGRPGETSTTAADDRRRNEQQTRTTHNGPGQRNKTTAAEAAAAKAQAATAGQRAAQQQCRTQTDRRTDTAKGNSGRTGAAEGKTKTPAQQTTVQE